MIIYIFGKEKKMEKREISSNTGIFKKL